MADGMVIDLEHRAQRGARVAGWILGCALAVPPVAALHHVAHDFGWSSLQAAGAFFTVALIETAADVRLGPGEIAETITLALAVSLAALGPALGLGWFKPDWNGKAHPIAALYPAWLVVMTAPTIVAHEHARAINPRLLPAHAAYEFLILFSAFATALSLAYSLWTRLHPETYARST